MDALEAGRVTPETAESFIHATHASCHHWMQVGTVANHGGGSSPWPASMPGRGWERPPALPGAGGDPPPGGGGLGPSLLDEGGDLVDVRRLTR